MYQRHIIGKDGERAAEQYLEYNGYLILEKNFNCRQGEIDIIARDLKQNEIVFIEIKTRTSKKYGLPAEAVTQQKKKHIYKVVEYFLYKYKLENEFVRIDVIEVYFYQDKTYKINHIKKALFA